MGKRRQEQDHATLGHLSAVPMRERGERDGRRYWRIRTLDTRETVRTGWWTRAELDLVLAEALRAPRNSRPSNPAGVRTVGDLLDTWAAMQGERLASNEIAPRSLDNYRRTCRHWKAAIADVLVQSLTRELVEDTLRTWRATGAMAPRTSKLAADVMAAVTTWGAKRGLCPALELDNLPSAQVDPDERVNCEYTPTREESDRVLAAIPPGRDRLVVELLGLTGARVGEVAALRVGSWDRQRGELLISGRDRSRSRRGKVRTRRWPVLGRLDALLLELTTARDPGEPLVAGLPKDVADLADRVIERACAAVKVERFTAHGLRRLVAQELLDITDPKTVASLTGHSVAVLLRDYMRPRAERLRDVVRRAQVRPAGLRVVGAQNPGTPDGEGE